MFDCYRNRKSLFCLKDVMRTSPIPRLCVLLQHCPSTLAPNYCTAATISKMRSFRVNYLVNNCGFSPETASEVSKKVSFGNSEKPDSVLKLFRNLHISDSRLLDTIRRAPWLLSSDPVKTISPKLEFFKSKGAPSSLLTCIVTANPKVLHYSLENHLIPSYDLIKRFLHSDVRTIVCIRRCPRLLSSCRLAHNVKLLLDNGVPESAITLLLRHWPAIINLKMDELKTKVDEVKELGFDPIKSSFAQALRVKATITKSSWERKVESFGRWGWSDEALNKAFTQRPFCMLTSDSKIRAVMQIFVNQMGWDPLVLAQYPILLSYSLLKRIIPRASVLQFLQSKGLIENASCGPFLITEKMFLQKYVNCFKNETPQVLKLYEEKLNLSR